MIVDGELLVEVGDPEPLPHGAKELLAIGADYAGVRHAIYPTACRTICSLPDTALAEVFSDDAGPDCLVCAATARAWDRVDRSAPSTWFRTPERGMTGSAPRSAA